MGLELDGQLFFVQSHQHVKPGKGAAFVRVRLKNVRTQQNIDRTLKSVDKFDEVELEEKKLQSLYHGNDGFHFMDLNTYEQITISADVVGDAVKFLQENLEVVGVCYRGEILQIKLPTFIEAEITQTEPGLKGDSSRAGNKPATIDTGATIQVPLFINTGERIKVDTRTGEYVERVKR